MNKYLCAFLSLFFATPLLSQVDTTKVAFVAYWSVGDSYDFEVSKTNQQWKKGELTKDRQQNYIANFTVIDSTDTSYTINWSYENNLVNTYEIPESLLDRFSKYKLMEVKYKTSEVGDFLEILNWEEVRDVTNNMFDDIIELTGGKDLEKQEALKKSVQPLRQIYNSKQGIEQLIMKELQYFHFPMGLEYDVTAPLIYKDELPNMLGGKPIKADAKLYFENIDFEGGSCILKQEMSLDPDGTMEFLKQLFNQMVFDDEKKAEALKTAVFKIEDRNTYEYYYDPGIPHKIETIREAVVDIGEEKGKRIDKITIELIYNK